MTLGLKKCYALNKIRFFTAKCAKIIISLCIENTKFTKLGVDPALQTLRKTLRSLRLFFCFEIVFLINYFRESSKS